MRIIIAGSGDTGTYLAKMLSFERQDVVLMSNDQDYLDTIDSSYNLMTCYGSATDITDLHNAGAQQASLFVAVTPCGSDNMIACELAHKLGTRTTVARIETDKYLRPSVEDYFNHCGIDRMVYPESLVADEIADFLEFNWSVKRHEISNGALLLSGLRIRHDSPIANRALKAMHPDGRKFHIVAVCRNGEVIIPDGNFILQPGDLSYFMLLPENEEYVAALIGRQTLQIKDIMIAGGGAITERIVKNLQGRASFTIVEPDRKECHRLAEILENADIVNAPIKDIHTLKEEGLEKMDAFIALSPDAPSNIIAALMAKESGVKRTVVQIEDLPYISEADKLNVDKIVNKKLITSGEILRSVLGNSAQVISLLTLENAEMAEITVSDGSGLCQGAIKDLRIPDGITFGGLIRDKKAMLVEGNTSILPGDILTVFFLPGTLHKVEKLLK